MLLKFVSIFTHLDPFRIMPYFTSRATGAGVCYTATRMWCASTQAVRMDVHNAISAVLEINILTKPSISKNKILNWKYIYQSTTIKFNFHVYYLNQWSMKISHEIFSRCLWIKRSAA